MRIHRSRLVNWQRVREFTADRDHDPVVVLKNGTRLDASPAYLKELQRSCLRRTLTPEFDGSSRATGGFVARGVGFDRKPLSRRRWAHSMRGHENTDPVPIMIFVISLAFFLGTASAARQDAARAAIAAQSRAFMQAIGKGDAAASRSFHRGCQAQRADVERPGHRPREHRRILAGSARAAGSRVWHSTPPTSWERASLRVETGSYHAMGADGRELGHGQYLLVWVKEKGGWKIGRDFAHGDGAPAAAQVPDRVGPPRNYASGIPHAGRHDIRRSSRADHGYANELAASAADAEGADTRTARSS